MSVNKLALKHPTLIMLYGFPGAGKSFFARQLCDDLHAAHVQGERIRYELFDQPRYDKQENEIITHLMDYMAEEFLRAGVSVVYDTNAMRLSQRRELRETARKSKAQALLIWLQIDAESAFARVSRRDHRKIDDKYSAPLDRDGFDSLAAGMQNPVPTEDYIVISGKHTYQTQRSSAVKKLYDLGLVAPTDAASKVVKPGMVNLVPNPMAGRVDPTRRNITIR
jgi:predicted kinase